VKIIATLLLLFGILGFSYGQFTHVDAGLTGINFGSADVGDYDNDGYLDLIINGTLTGGSNDATNLLYNNDGNLMFDNVVTNIQGSVYSSIHWGDYDNDGDLDLAVSGYPINTVVYKNQGNGIFAALNVEFGIGNSGPPSNNWVDYDNDGDLDLFVIAQEITRLFMNCGNDSFIPTDIDFGLYVDAKSRWADYDNDGDSDLAIIGVINNPAWTYVARLFRNDNQGSFTEVSFQIEGVQSGYIDWIDYDCDGDLDVFLCGHSGSPFGLISKLYRNDGNNTFTNSNANFQGVWFGSCDWGDYDNDGDPDLLLSGASSQVGYNTVLYRNDSGTFTAVNSTFVGIQQGSCEWGDLDNDNDLDVLIAGNSTNSGISHVYRNDQGTINVPPTAPGNLRAAKVGNFIIFEWDASTDQQTPSNGLSYVLRIGCYPGGCDISSPMSSSTGSRKIAQRGYVNSGNCSWKIAASALADQTEYYWSVQAIDTAYAGSSFATESVYQVSLNLNSPNGGEVWRGGESKNIQWISNPTINQVNIYLSSDNGENWVLLTPTPVMASAGNYEVLLPDTPSSLCLIKIENAGDNTVFDESDIHFTMLPQAPVIAITPHMHIDFGTEYLGWQSSPDTIWLSNTGTAPLAISSYDQLIANSPFELMNASFPLILSPGDSTAVQVAFSPNALGVVDDNLIINNNSENFPVLTITLVGNGAYLPPQSPENVQIEMNNNSVDLSWDPVVMSVYNTTMIPDYYLVFFNGSGDLNGDYYYLGRSYGTSFNHRLTGIHASSMFYHVRAFKTNRSDTLESYHLKTSMTESEVLRLLSTW